MNAVVLRLMLVDDHAVVREGLRAVLEDGNGFVVVAEADCGDDALRTVEAAAPDVILIDLVMPGLPVAETIRRLKQKVPTCHIVVFTSFAEDERLRDTLQAGAIGYLLKDATRDDLVSAVRAVAEGQPWFHETMRRQLVELLRGSATADPFAALTPRERNVLELIGEGLSNRRIATRLGLTEGTVKGYVSTVLEKIGVDDRTQAALYFTRANTGPTTR
ncbi:DNA-binding NarL/FixJ family response regulator [Dokdonella fugitiva]|uniref:DNA-binding NarL/FixJ family response regulator n=1 Tax=Dokdonella fugitiva TaxID=328517 RepID=A0A839ETQ0_9GAMM|nr:response regulator transcription factor [Dokdonella fugitiva]MBA8887867.1 DNA-binding NarL/FixJ family response regulator [Dokdonella fugitiva]